MTTSRAPQRPKEPAGHARVIAIRSGAAFEAWLDRHASDRAGVWLKLAKKGSGIPSLTDGEAVDIGLCYGWISGQRKSLDHVYYLQKYVPRRPESAAQRHSAPGSHRGPGDETPRTGRVRGARQEPEVCGDSEADHRTHANGARGLIVPHPGRAGIHGMRARQWRTGATRPHGDSRQDQEYERVGRSRIIAMDLGVGARTSRGEGI